ncbi:hypothetical protein HD597_011030 [Nonomuraea thailandensis]|uniref:Uncharacterized protein n=1 Tax=Nonomuraea thailandensis TaxID=1188745 RepID=A0A9X2GU76_9ACTN|nr:hypothetical protein [Nonomuraea thailandensis]MCP2364010.1 hypothetical protein [Nonomuraea thailandensis]
MIGARWAGRPESGQVGSTYGQQEIGRPATTTTVVPSGVGSGARASGRVAAACRAIV